MNLIQWVTCHALPRQRRPSTCREDARSRELREAQQRAAALAKRADSVVPQLEGRLRRNHWGETVAAIARREP